MSKTKWRQISVPDEILKDVEVFVDKHPLYQTPTEFTRYALVEKLTREGFYKDEETQIEIPMKREEIHIKDPTISSSLMENKAEMSRKTSTRKKKKPRVKASLDEVTDQAAVEG